MTSKKAPGPGEYEAPDLDVKKLNIIVSKFKKAPLGCKYTSPRFKKINIGPGPSSYRESDSLSPYGRYVNAKYRGHANPHFS